MQFLTAQIDATTAQIATLQTKINDLQERQQLLISTEQTCQLALAQVDTALTVLGQADANQINAFKALLAAKFEADALPMQAVIVSVEPTAPAAPESAQNQPILEARTVSKYRPKTPKQSKKTPAKSAKDKQLDTIFGERITQKKQFLILKEALNFNDRKVGTLIKSRSDAKGWNVVWGKDKAGLFWTVGDGWDIEALRSGSELKGNWKDFCLAQFLECNGIDLDECLD